jgi:hypothetical protein
MRIALPLTLLVAASVITEAIIGPTHGVQTRPRLTPSKSPLQNPVACLEFEVTKLESFVKTFSIIT